MRGNEGKERVSNPKTGRWVQGLHRRGQRPGGANHGGERRNKLHREALDGDGSRRGLAPLLAAYAVEHQPNKGFGNFIVRTGTVKATVPGLNFHD